MYMYSITCIIIFTSSAFFLIGNFQVRFVICLFYPFLCFRCGSCRTWAYRPQSGSLRVPWKRGWPSWPILPATSLHMPGWCTLSPSLCHSRSHTQSLPPRVPRRRGWPSWRILPATRTHLYVGFRWDIASEWNVQTLHPSDIQTYMLNWRNHPEVAVCKINF